MILIFLSVLNINTLDKIISPKSIAWNGDSEIIYTSDLSSYILKYNINNKTISPIFTQQGYNNYLSISPDRKFIAFTNSILQSPPQIIIYNIKEKRKTSFKRNFFAKSFEFLYFAPDSKSLYFSMAGPLLKRKIYKAVIDTNGGVKKITPVISNMSNNFSPIYFNDTLLYISNKSGNYNIFIATPDTSYQITNTPEDESYLSLSPDRKWMLFVRKEGNYGNLYIRDFNKNEYKITDTPTRKIVPIWSPAGNKIAYLEMERRQWKVVIITSSFISHHPETVVCPNCGFKNKWGYNFCINCGTSLKDAKETIEKSLIPENVDSLVQGLIRKHQEITQKEEKKITIPPTPPISIPKPVKKEEKALPTIPQEEKVVKKVTPFVPKKEKKKEILPPIPPEKPVIKKPRKPLHLRKIDPTILFTVPKPNIIPSLAIILSGGTAFATQAKGFSPLGTFSIGLGDIAQVEMSTTGVINSVLKGSSSIPTIAFQMSFSEILKSRGKLGKDAYDLSIGLKGSWWNATKCCNHTYSTRIAHLYGVFGKKFIPKLNVYIGSTIADTRIKTNVSPAEVVNNPFLFFAGAELKMTKETNLMFEISQLSGYNYEPDGVESSKDLIKGWWISLGNRIFLAPWIVINMGGRFDSVAGKFQGIADAKLWLGANIIISTSDIIDYYAQ